MFESVRQNDRSGLVYVTSLLISLFVHALAVGLLVVVPLVFFNVLQAEELLTILIEPPGLPPPIPPPVPPGRTRAAAPDRGNIGRIDHIPEGITEDLPLPPDGPDVEYIPGPLAGIPGAPGDLERKGPDISELLRKGVVIDAPPLPRHTPRTPVRVSHVDPSKILRKVNPVYPVLAIKARVSGTVLLEAVIDEEGDVRDVKVVEGHPLLVKAAVEAVRQWKYSPTILNGEPVPIVAIVSVIFQFD